MLKSLENDRISGAKSIKKYSFTLPLKGLNLAAPTKKSVRLIEFLYRLQ